MLMLMLVYQYFVFISDKIKRFRLFCIKSANMSSFILFVFNYDYFYYFYFKFKLYQNRSDSIRKMSVYKSSTGFFKSFGISNFKFLEKNEKILFYYYSLVELGIFFIQTQLFFNRTQDAIN